MKFSTIHGSFFILILFLWACQPENTLPSPITINVGKGPDALLLNGNSLYVANVEDTTISVIDINQDKVIHIINGIRYPWGMVKIAGTNSMAVSAYDKQVALVDLTNNQISKLALFNDFIGGITASLDGSFLYVVAIGTNKVYKLDATNLDSLDYYDTGNAPDGVGISGDGTKIYVSNTGDSSVSIINTITKATQVLQLGGKPELIHANQNHSHIYVSNFFGNKVHIFDTATDSIFHEITEVNQPEEAVLSLDESKLYVVNFSSKKVSVFSLPNYTKLPEEYDTGNGPIGVIPINNKIYVTNYSDNTVSVITE